MSDPDIDAEREVQQYEPDEHPDDGDYQPDYAGPSAEGEDTGLEETSDDELAEAAGNRESSEPVLDMVSADFEEETEPPAGAEPSVATTDAELIPAEDARSEEES